MLAVDGFILAIVQFYLPLPIVHTLGCTGIAFVFILDFYINGTTINKKQFIGLVFCIFGIILTTNGKWMVNLIS